jgi:hypothetical protein
MGATREVSSIDDARDAPENALHALCSAMRTASQTQSPVWGTGSTSARWSASWTARGTWRRSVCASCGPTTKRRIRTRRRSPGGGAPTRPGVLPVCTGV